MSDRTGLRFKCGSYEMCPLTNIIDQGLQLFRFEIIVTLHWDPAMFLDSCWEQQGHEGWPILGISGLYYQLALAQGPPDRLAELFLECMAA